VEELEEGQGYTATDLERIGKRWVDRIRAQEKAEEDWIDDAEGAEVAYLANDKSDTASKGHEVPDFNILHSNVETIVPSIYNSTPAPDIRPRHNAKDDLAKQVADIFERVIAAQIDDNVLDTEIEATAQDTFLAGRGITRIKFDADEEPVIEVDAMGMPVESVRLVNERVIFENVSWRDYRFGPCKRFKDRPWEAFRHCISQEELERITDDEIAQAYSGETPTEKEELDVDVWEIWCKETRRVYFVVEASGKVVSIKDDPLGLSKFFTVPNIIQPIKSTHNTLPVCPYRVYRSLAEELDTATDRINAIMSGLRVRGLIAGDAEPLELLSEAGDNEFVPVPNVENLVAAGGIEKAVMWWPIETAIAVLQQLYVQREQTKQTIYEITGISDIIRGQGDASETATAQNIKTQWGSLRIKKMQRLIERHVRDLFKLAAEVISQHFSYQTISKASGIQIAPEMMPLLGQPFDHYRIDVESDSTVRADLTKSRQEMASFLEGTASFLQTMAPIIGQAPATAGPIIDMYASFARQFSLGKSGEDALDQLAELAKQAAAQPRPNPEAEAKKAEMQFEMEKFKAEQQGKAEERQLKMVGMQLDNQLKRRELGLKGQELDLEESKAEVDAAARMVEIEMEDEQARAVKFGDE